MALLTGAVLAAGAGTAPAPVTAHIAPFADATSGKGAWSGVDAALRDLLTASVSQDAGVALLDRERLDLVLKEQKLNLEDLAGSAAAVRVGKLLGARRLVTGSVISAEGQVLAVAHILDVESAVVVKTCQARGRPEELLDLAIDLGRQVAEGLKIPFQPPRNLALDKSPIASLHFLRGLGYLHAGNADAALLEFMTCLDAAPDHPVVRYWMGQAWSRQAEYEHAAIELEAFLRTPGTGPEQESARGLLAECRKHLPPEGAPVLKAEPKP